MPARSRAYVDRLRAADALVLVFPVWFDGLPAIMQGYFQRVFLPGVATIIDENGLFHRNLANLKRLAAVCAYGEIRADVAKKHDPPRRFVRGNIGALIEPSGQFEYLAIYGMDFSTAPEARRISQAGNARLQRLVGDDGGRPALRRRRKPSGRDDGAYRGSSAL